MNNMQQGRKTVEQKYTESYILYESKYSLFHIDYKLS